ncbi:MULTISPECIES: M23 family metallopeptidase [Streptomyces]|uniref:M23 family metallopeptidase n=1 Tax=Streptomyces tendae TaxID=1932 RepID=A0A6B3QK58_STRTE|nr:MULTISPECIES: M23 family metallopeptidase [unclassified Streptomyces]MZG17522.1 peptidoglycan DD-metalloendopeptidase family protein [Streptomyces sp. SID5914]NEV88312.1 M23 family metallopeptidase [Streptomyces tendae]BET48159.1 M23 family metallopeptidase [Kitasatospora aureofaciens]MBQ0965188.1 M23 family metallopeptidase [Streptomyces sp. RK74B]MBQ1005004.1 M23 family metallopeptidase [Streptomyces sp. RK23]
MNDRHPSGTSTTPAPASDAASAHYASYGTGEAQYGDLTTYGGYTSTGFSTGTADTSAFDSAFAADPLFGSMPGHYTGTHETTGAYDATQWSTGGEQPLHYDAYAAQHHAAYDTGAYDTTTWTSGYQQHEAVPPHGTGTEATGQWDTGAWSHPDQSGAPADATQQWGWGTQTFDTGAHETSTFATGTFHTGAFAGGPVDTGAYDATQWNAGPAATDAVEDHARPAEHPAPAPDDAAPVDHGTEPAPYDGELAATGELPTVTALLDDQEEATPAARIPAARTGSRAGARSRRRQPAKRSALLTIAVPSACVMSVAGIAAASVGSLTGDEGADAAASAPDPGNAKAAPVKPSAANNKLDTQLTSLAAGADDFADRASRTQERIDLKAQQDAEKRRAAEEAARKERLRPKFALPVEQHGLSAYYGQAGINWMSVHTGIDFPVSYGTKVMAATDGTVRTQYNSAYGNMMIVTAKDGTETWYCHLSSYQVPSGTTVKAGDAIAFSGNSGNSTGPHLHFEVRPAGGSSIDPLPWLRSHGISPT